MLSKKQLFTKGMVDISPHMLSVIPFGIICGAIGVELGFDPYLVYAMSFIIFGGASQIVFLQVLSGGASNLVAVTSVGIINSRHLLYGAVLSEHLSDMKITWKIIISYFLVDQAFAVSNNYLKKNKDNNKSFHLLGSGFTTWIVWQITTIIGIFLGSIIPDKLGLSFAIPLTFLALIINDLRKLINVIVIIISGLIATLGYQSIPFKAYIIIASASGLLVAFILTKIIKNNND